MKTLVSLLWLFALACAPMTASAATLREGWQAVDGLRLFYREGGSPDDPTVVFLHGYPLSSIQYARVMEQLADRHLHVIAVDYPSFGYSDAPDRRSYRYSFDISRRRWRTSWPHAASIATACTCRTTACRSVSA